MSEVRIEYTALSAVARWPRNPKKHDEENLELSIRRFGFTQPLLVDEGTEKLVAGHGRLEALLRMQKADEVPPDRIQIDPETGEWLVPVIRGVEFVSEREAEAFLLADNRLVEMGGWDEKALSTILEDLRASGDVALAGIGFDVEEVAQLSREISGTTPLGMTPADRAVVYENNEIKQIVLYFEGKEYDEVVLMLDKARTFTGVDSNTELFLQMLHAKVEEANEADPPIA